MLSTFRLTAVLLALSLLAAACGSSADDAASGQGDAPEAAAASGGSVLDVSAPSADGGTIDLSTYAGQDLMLWFWAPW